MVPKRGEASNLVVPVAVSASHVAFNSIRMEPTWMILGHAAGVAAAMITSSVDSDAGTSHSNRVDIDTSGDAPGDIQRKGKEVDFGAIDVRELQQRLLKQGQLLEPPPSPV
jgi:hypothetical protein